MADIILAPFHKVKRSNDQLHKHCEEYIKQNYGVEPVHSIADHLGISAGVVTSIAKSIGFNTSKKVAHVVATKKFNVHEQQNWIV